MSETTAFESTKDFFESRKQMILERIKEAMGNSVIQELM
jgi:hypothetical protein